MVHKTEVDTDSEGVKHCLNCRRQAFRIHFDWYCTCQEQRAARMDFEQWLNYGVENGYCSEQFCNTHDGYPLHPTEEQAWDRGDDPCMHLVRLGSMDDWEYDYTPL